MFHRDLLSENEAAVQRFLSSNYFASENLVTDPTTSSLTWERVHAGFAPVGMLAFVNNAVTSATRRSTMASCDAVISTLDDAVKALAADTAPAYAKLEREVAGDSLVVDAEVLETLQPRSKERPDEYVGLKHATYRSAVSLGNGLNGEDYVLIESVGRDVDPDGYAFAFKSLRSVDVPGVFSHVDKATTRGSLLASHDMDSVTRRGNLHNFMLILSETKFTGLLRMQIWLDVDLPSHGNGIAIPLDSSFASIHDALSLGLRYRRLLERSFTASVKKDPSAAVSIYAAANLTPMSRMRVTQCQVCERKLGLLTRKRYSCDVCKASLCSTCARTTDMCSWRLCACCYGRNHSLFSRQIRSKLTTPFSRLSFFARRSSIAYRQSIVSVLPTRQRQSKSYGQPVSANIKPFQAPADSKDSRRTSSSDSSSSTRASSNLASSAISTLHASSSELDQITELEDDQYEPYAPGTSYTDALPLNGVKLLDDSYLHRMSGSNPAWPSVDDDDDEDEDVELYLEHIAQLERESMSVRESLSGQRPSFQVL